MKVVQINATCGIGSTGRICVSISQLDINGRDLIDMGVSNGPKIGEILNFLLNAVIEEKCFNTKTDLIQYLKNSFKID